MWHASSIQPLILTSEQQRELRRIVNRPRASVQDVRRAWIILIERRVSTTAGRRQKPKSTARWWVCGKADFASTGWRVWPTPPDAAAKSGLSSELKARILTQATQPPRDASVERSHDGARGGRLEGHRARLWSANEIKPHLIRVFKLSQDPQV